MAKRLSAIKEAFTTAQVVTNIAETTGLTKKEVKSVLEALSDVMTRHLKKGACGMFKLFNFFKITVVKKPARKARKGINPFTGEETMFKAKPASRKVKVRALKRVKDMVE